MPESSAKNGPAGNLRPAIRVTDKHFIGESAKIICKMLVSFCSGSNETYNGSWHFFYLLWKGGKIKTRVSMKGHAFILSETSHPLKTIQSLKRKIRKIIVCLPKNNQNFIGLLILMRFFRFR